MWLDCLFAGGCEGNDYQAGPVLSLIEIGPGTGLLLRKMGEKNQFGIEPIRAIKLKI
jgi:hypothetical protein